MDFTSLDEQVAGNVDYAGRDFVWKASGGDIAFKAIVSDGEEPALDLETSGAADEEILTCVHSAFAGGYPANNATIFDANDNEYRVSDCNGRRRRQRPTFQIAIKPKS